MTRHGRLAVGALATAVALTSSACVGRLGNNDGPKRPGEPNPAQPYQGERQQLERDSQRGA